MIFCLSFLSLTNNPKFEHFNLTNNLILSSFFLSFCPSRTTKRHFHKFPFFRFWLMNDPIDTSTSVLFEFLALTSNPKRHFHKYVFLSFLALTSNPKGFNKILLALMNKPQKTLQQVLFFQLFAPHKQTQKDTFNKCFFLSFLFLTNDSKKTLTNPFTNLCEKPLSFRPPSRHLSNSNNFSECLKQLLRQHQHWDFGPTVDGARQRTRLERTRTVWH